MLARVGDTASLIKSISIEERIAEHATHPRIAHERSCAPGASPCAARPREIQLQRPGDC